MSLSPGNLIQAPDYLSRSAGMDKFVRDTAINGEDAFKNMVVDLINPFDNLPVINTLSNSNTESKSQSKTTNQIDTSPGDILGAGLFGGPGGLLIKLASTLFSAARAGSDHYAYHDPYESDRAQNRGIDFSV